MKIPMKVFSIERSRRQAPATLLDGTQVTATIDCVEVQLVPGPGDDHGTMKLSLVGPEADEAMGWTVGQTLEVSI